MQRKNDQDVKRGDNHSGEQRQTEQELQGDSGTQDLGEITGGDGNFARDPQQKGSAA